MSVNSFVRGIVNFCHKNRKTFSIVLKVLRELAVENNKNIVDNIVPLHASSIKNARPKENKDKTTEKIDDFIATAVSKMFGVDKAVYLKSVKELISGK